MRNYYPERASRLKSLGYVLRRNQVDAWRRRWAYRTSPDHGTGGGPINYFDSLADVDRYLGQVEWVRGIQSEARDVT